MTDLISIITPTYNRAELIGQSIRSVLAQTYRNWEMIIVDDGSTDHTRDIVSQYRKRDSRIKYFYQENKGTAASRNKGIMQSGGKYLTFLDSDDCYYPKALRILLSSILKADANTKLVYGDFSLFFTDNQRLKPIRAAPPLPRPKLYLQFMLSGANPISPCACIAEKQAIIDLGMFNETFLNREDVELWTRLVQKYDIAKIDALIARYRVHRRRKTSELGMARYDRDRIAYQFFNSLTADKLFPDCRTGQELSAKLDGLARRMLNPTNLKSPRLDKLVCFDTGLHILRTAQKYHFNPRREQYILSVEKHVPNLLKNYFDSDLRLRNVSF